MNRNRFNEPTLYNSNRTTFSKTNTFKDLSSKNPNNCSKLVQKFTSIGDLSEKITSPPSLDTKSNIKFSTMVNTTATILKFKTSSFSYSSNALNKLNDKLERSNLTSLKFSRYDTVQKSDAADHEQHQSRELRFNDFKLLKKSTVSSADLKSYCNNDLSKLKKFNENSKQELCANEQNSIAENKKPEENYKNKENIVVESLPEITESNNEKNVTAQVSEALPKAVEFRNKEDILAKVPETLPISVESNNEVDGPVEDHLPENLEFNKNEKDLTEEDNVVIVSSSRNQTKHELAKSYGFNEDQIGLFEETFQIFDKDSDGAITFYEIKSVMNALGFYPCDENIRKGIRDIDKDNSGTVDFEEFINMMSKSRKFKTMNELDEELKEIFQIFDKNQDGYIDTAELKDVLVRLGENITDEEVFDMIKEADTDGDQKVSFTEFRTILRSDNKQR